MIRERKNQTNKHISYAQMYYDKIKTKTLDMNMSYFVTGTGDEMMVMYARITIELSIVRPDIDMSRGFKNFFK